MNEKHFILATAGHVDHGKSALVHALTGTHPDRLPEEKARGITIELGFAHLALASPEKPNEEQFSIGIVDVPGHEDFVKNMVAGVGSIDLALLVVAADDGWMPQTEEHLQILAYLGVHRAVVALTKSDLVKSNSDVENAIRAKLDGSPFADATVVKTSVFSGFGLDELKAQLAREFSALTPPREIGKPRLFVDRAFSLRGVGSIVTGTLSGGKFKTGDEVIVQPQKISARIRSIQTHNREVSEIGPGSRVALNIPDVPVAPRKGARGVRRGDVVTRENFGASSFAIDVLLTRSARLPARTKSLAHGAQVRVHHGSGHAAARIFFYESDALAVGDSALAQLRFDAPVFAFAGDRFIVRDGSEQRTLAGGVVLDPDACLKMFRCPKQQEFLAARARAPDDVNVFVQTQLARDGFSNRSALLLKSRFGADEINAAIARLEASGAAVMRGEIVANAKSWRDLMARAAAAIDAEHAAHPNRIGLELAQLRGALARDLLLPEIFDALVAELCKNGFARAHEAIKRDAHRPALPPQLQPAGAKIRTALSANPFDPPSRKELASDAISQQALRFLRDTQEILEIGADVVLTSDAFLKMRQIVSDFICAKGAASVSDLRQALKSSRRVVVPFLERLDRDGVTRRIGDKRVLARFG